MRYSNLNTLKEKWIALFSDKEQNIILSLFNGAVSKYMRMSSNQFKGECNRTFAAEKEQARRKQILKKREKVVYPRKLDHEKPV
jgi:hypothetical protein